MVNRQARLQRESYRSSIIGGALILAFVIGVGFLAYRVQVARNPPEYEGIIVEKWAGYSHTIEGSFPYFRVRVKNSRGEQMDVDIDEHTYHRATVGAWIRKTKSGIQLEPGSAPLSLWHSHESPPSSFSFAKRISIECNPIAVSIVIPTHRLSPLPDCVKIQIRNDEQNFSID